MARVSAGNNSQTKSHTRL